jgi:hypothetical protein
LRSPTAQLKILPTAPDVPNLRIEVPLGVLTAIVRDDLSWDEAFIGYWCRFERHPDVYHAGFWRLLQAPYFKRSVETAPADSQPHRSANDGGRGARRARPRGRPHPATLRLVLQRLSPLDVRFHRDGGQATWPRTARVAHLIAELNRVFAEDVTKV